MGKLIVLEWKKNRAGRYGLAVAILTAALALFLFAQVYLASPTTRLLVCRMLRRALSIAPRRWNWSAT